MDKVFVVQIAIRGDQELLEQLESNVPKGMCISRVLYRKELEPIGKWHLGDYDLQCVIIRKRPFNGKSMLAEYIQEYIDFLKIASVGIRQHGGVIKYISFHLYTSLRDCSLGKIPPDLLKLLSENEACLYASIYPDISNEGLSQCFEDLIITE